jgi:hypothetical protein
VRIYEALSDNGKVVLLVDEHEYDPGVPGLHIDTPAVDGGLFDRADVEKLHKTLGEWLERNRA